MAFCMNCGTQLPDGAKFCLECGTKLGDIKLKQATKRETAYEGTVYKCPNCGDILDAYESVCETCGYERRGSKATNSVQKLSQKLQEIEAQRPSKKMTSVFKKAMVQDHLSKTDEQKIDLIKNYAIPNTKEDIMEFAVLAVSNIDPAAFSSMNNTAMYETSRKALSDAWMSKFEQVYQKGRLMFGETTELQNLYQQYLKKRKEIKRKKASLWIMLAGMMGFTIILSLSVVIGTTISDNNSKAEEDARLETLITQITSAIDCGDYKLAMMYADRVRYNGSYDEEIERDWEIQRDYWIDKIIEEAAKSGIFLESPDDPAEDPQTPQEITVQTESTAAPSATPAPEPSATPTPAPSATPTPAPSATPTPAPSATPTPAPSATPTPAPSAEPKKHSEVADETCNVRIDIECEENLFLNSYDINIYIDEEPYGTVAHGDTKTILISLDKGIHTIKFEEADYNGIFNEVDITISESTHFSYCLSCHFLSIEIESTEQKSADIISVNYSENSIENEYEYSYMHDKHNVYIATPLSDTKIKISKWKKESSTSKKAQYDCDIGTFDITEKNCCFVWLSSEQTAFLFQFRDSSNSYFDKTTLCTFTVNSETGDSLKGSNYNKKTCCYSFQNDKYHLYRAIPLSKDIIKIEVWYRSSSLEKFVYAYDLCTIKTNDINNDFEWNDIEHSSFSITLCDMQNSSHWEGNQLVSFIVEDPDYKYADINDYLENGK